MNALRYTLLSEGSSDVRLLPLLSWTLEQYLPHRAVNAVWADLRRAPRKPKSLAEKIQLSLDLFPCDLLFVHRDSDRELPESRVQEILAAKAQVSQCDSLPVVCVVPVRMQEAWFLFNEAAIRTAAGNPNGHGVLSLPSPKEVEHLPDPKARLEDLMRGASGLSGQRRRRVPVTRYSYRIPELIEDFSPLRALPAFQRLEASIVQVISGNGWQR